MFPFDFLKIPVAKDSIDNDDQGDGAANDGLTSMSQRPITTDKGVSFPFTVCGIFVHLKSVLTSQSLKLTFLHLSFKFVIIYPSIYTVSCFIHKPTYWTWIHVFLHSFLYGSYFNPVSKMQWSQVSDSKHIRLEKQALQQPPSRHMRSDSKSKKKYVTE